VDIYTLSTHAGIKVVIHVVNACDKLLAHVVACRCQAAERGGLPATTLPDRLEAAAAYISQTTERVERLKARKRELTSASSSSGAAAAAEMEVQHLGSGLHAILFTGAPPSDGASFHRAVRAVEEAGAEVQNAHFSVVGARSIYTIHTLVSRRSMYTKYTLVIGHGSHIYFDFSYENLYDLLQVTGRQGGIERVVQRLRAALRGDA
jgi:hypothetical protein